MGDGKDEDDMLSGRQGGGDSGGGAYPNPHSGKGVGHGGKEGFLGRGGQTEMPYHGPDQLGDEELGDNPNAPAKGQGD